MVQGILLVCGDVKLNMLTLKELTSENHKIAENHVFTKLLLSGKITKQIYATYLANQLQQYSILESKAVSLLNKLPGIYRTHLILQDLVELNTSAIVFQTTVEYFNRIIKLNSNELWSHIYTKHMGDLYGGQIIKSKVPGSGKMYQFNNRLDLINNLRSNLDLNMATEANWCFKSTIDLFDNIANEYNL